VKLIHNEASFSRSTIFLRDDVAAMWHEQDPFSAAQRQAGTIYRDKEGRRTLRFEYRNHSYFLKLHQGVGWKEILKNLVQGRPPVLGAENEYRAIRALEHLQIDTLSVAAYGRRGCNPATQLSFLITDELQNVESLEDFCARWPQSPPEFSLKKKLIERVATIARTLHKNGINHRDFYLCHFLLEKKSFLEKKEPPETETSVIADLDDRKLFLMDLHRAQIRTSVPNRWLIKDLGALYYSALDIGLTQRDVLRFLRIYRQQALHDIFAGEANFWRAVKSRAEKIYRRDFKREPRWPL
jgi:heptose I phosphotransferase